MDFLTFLIDLDFDNWIAIRYFSFTNLAKVLELKSGISRIGD